MDKKIDCKKIYDEMVEYIKTDLYIYEHIPTLVAYLSSDDYGSELYTRLKAKTAQDCNIPYRINKLTNLDASLPTEYNHVKTIGCSRAYPTTILQLPATKLIKEIYSQICDGTDNDIDGFSFLTDISKKLYTSNVSSAIKPATMCAVMSILEHCFGTRNISGKKIAVVGARSETVGKYLPRELMNRNATITLLHSKSILHDNIFEGYDAVISCVGKAGLIKQRHFGNTTNCICIDVGISRNDDGKPVGDFDTDIREYQYYTPYVNGVGLLTRIFLMKNYIMKLKDSRMFVMRAGDAIGITTLKFKEEFVNRNIYIKSLVDELKYTDDYSSIYYMLKDSIYKDDIINILNSSRNKRSRLHFKNDILYVGSSPAVQIVETIKGKMICDYIGNIDDEIIDDLNKTLSFIPYDNIDISNPLRYFNCLYTDYIKRFYNQDKNLRKLRVRQRIEEYDYDDDDEGMPIHTFDF